MTLWFGLPVLNLQEQLHILEKNCYNGTLAAEDKPFFWPLAGHKTHPVPGGSGLQVLQTQITLVRTSQEQLLQQVHNLTRNPGTTTSSFHARCVSTLPTELHAQPAKEAF